MDRRFAFLTDEVRAQPVDRSWAAEATGWIETAAAAFPRSRVARIDCRSTLCQVEANHEDEAARERFENFFFPNLPDLPRGAARRVQTSDGRPASLVVLARAGHAVPRMVDP